MNRSTNVRRMNAASCSLLASGLFGALASPAAAQSSGLLVPDWSNDRIMLFDKTTGDLINADFITEAATGTTMSSPKEALQVGDEIWVSDQTEDRIIRFSLDGTRFLGDALNRTVHLIDNVRGFEVFGGRIYVACDTGAFANSVAVFTLAGDLVTSVSAGTSPFDIVAFGGELLVSDGDTDDITRHDANMANLGFFVQSPESSAIAWPQQMTVASDNQIVVANFSIPDGVYVYSSTGSQLEFYDTGAQGGLRGAYRLPDGRYLFTNGAGVFRLDPAAGSIVNIIPNVNSQYINELNATGCDADFNNDGQVDFFDFLDFAAAFGAEDPSADWNSDGQVDFFDYLDFAADFGACE
ncbi:MAG: hypothetical protein SFZ23_02005 [Planctomycetota bacterium]|nr:hypothetical protein [Planctomycetota bacterium]